MQTKTTSGIDVKLSLREIYGRIDVMAKFTVKGNDHYGSLGRWKTENGRRGFQMYSKGMEILLTIPKNSKDHFATAIADMRKEYENEEREKRSHLISRIVNNKKLPFNSNADDEKYRELMKQLPDDNSSDFSGSEDDGIRLHIQARRGEAIAKAKSFCDHDWKFEWVYDLTSFATLQATRHSKCKKCGHAVKHSECDGAREANEKAEGN